MTGSHRGSQERRLASVVSVEMWLRATELQLKERVPELLASAERAHVEPLFVWSGLSMDEVERIDSFLSALLTHHLADSNAAEGLATAKAVVDSVPLVVLASLIGRAARIDTTKKMWLDWPAGLQLDPADPQTVALVEHVIARVPEFLESVGVSAEVTVGGESIDISTAEGAANAILLQAGVQLSVMPVILEQLEEAAGVEDFDKPSSNDLVQALIPVRDQVDGLVAACAEASDGELPMALRMVAESAPRQAKKLFLATLGYAIATAADPANWETREELSRLDAGLPPILVDATREELRIRPIGTPQRRSTVGVVSTTGRPQLYFDELSQSVGVQLPTPLDPAGRSWRVTYGGNVVTLPAVGLEDSLPRPVVLLEEPVREVLVELGEDQAWRVPAINTEDPILIFGADGQSVADKVSLHSTSATVVFPVDAKLVDPVTGDEVPMLTDPAPSKWELWQIAEIDLRDIHAVQVRRDGKAGEVRSASPMRRPRLSLPYARLDGAVTAHGTPVHAGGPVAVFPPTLSGEDESWHVILTAFQGYGEFSTEPMMVYDLDVPAAGGEVDILTDDDYPWLGEFVVRLINPRGQSFEKHFAIAEQAELSVTYRGGGDGFRIPTPEGLSPAEIRVTSGEKPLEVTPALVRLEAEESEGIVELSTEEGAWLSIQVTPGVLKFEIPLSDESVARRTTTLVTRPGRFDSYGQIAISAPGELRHAHIAVSSGERDICRVPVSRVGDNGLVEFGKFADRISLLKDITISLDWTRVTGRRRLSVPLLEASSTSRIRAIRFNEEDPNIIEAIYSAEIEHLPKTLWLWSTKFPWQAPVAVEMVEGECPLPEELYGHGPFVAQVTLGLEQDRQPQWPASDAVVLAHSSDDDIEAEVVAAQWQNLSQEQLSRLWSLFATQRAGRGQVLASASENLTAGSIGSVLSQNPRAGLASLNQSSIALDDQPGMLIASGLVLGDFTMTAPTPGRRRVPWLGALASLADLAGEGADRKKELNYLRNTGGEALLGVLASGQDTTLESACIDQSSVQITALPRAQADAILAQVFDVHRMVPGPLTDDDARFTAIYEVVQNRDEIVESGIMTRLAVASRQLFQIVSKTSPRLRKAVNVRFHKLDGIDADDASLHWTLVPGTSLLIAVAARALARRKAANPEVSDEAVRQLIPLWAQLADLVPTLVMSDILIADALVTHALNGDLTAEPEPEPETETSTSDTSETTATE